MVESSGHRDGQPASVEPPLKVHSLDDARRDLFDRTGRRVEIRDPMCPEDPFGGLNVTATSLKRGVRTVRPALLPDVEQLNRVDRQAEESSCVRLEHVR